MFWSLNWSTWIKVLLPSTANIPIYRIYVKKRSNMWGILEIRIPTASTSPFSNCTIKRGQGTKKRQNASINMKYRSSNDKSVHSTTIYEWKNTVSCLAFWPHAHCRCSESIGIKKSDEPGTEEHSSTVTYVMPFGLMLTASVLINFIHRGFTAKTHKK